MSKRKYVKKIKDEKEEVSLSQFNNDLLKLVKLPNPDKGKYSVKKDTFEEK